MKAAINKPGVKLLDARTQGEIDGKDLRDIKRGGFIESSVPVYWEDTLDPATKTFKPAAEITKLYRDNGVTADGRRDRCIARSACARRTTSSRSR